jgi:hypothetical protein
MAYQYHQLARIGVASSAGWLALAGVEKINK